MSEILTASTQLHIIHCGGCGWQYAIPESYHSGARENGEAWNWRCPNRRCSWSDVAIRDGELAKVKRKLEQEKARADREANNAAFWNNAHTAALTERDKERAKRTRAEKRAAGGVCPCCNRSFAATKMAAHMKSKHPGFAKRAA